jgi:hypothetical protein
VIGALHYPDKLYTIIHDQAFHIAYIARHTQPHLECTTVSVTYGSACQYCVPSSLDIKCLQISKEQGSSVRFLQAPSVIHVVNDRIISILLTTRSILITRRIYLSCVSNILEQCHRYIWNVKTYVNHDKS